MPVKVPVPVAGAVVYGPALVAVTYLDDPRSTVFVEDEVEREALRLQLIGRIHRYLHAPCVYPVEVVVDLTASRGTEVAGPCLPCKTEGPVADHGYPRVKGVARKEVLKVYVSGLVTDKPPPPPCLIERLRHAHQFGRQLPGSLGLPQLCRGIGEVSADGGTLFLDEVADLPLDMQVKLLRAIQEKAVRPVGSQQEIPVNVRILSATHKNLHQLVETGQFRQDLYFRINVIELHMPALRERPEDIPLLVEHFLRKIAREWGTDVPRLETAALRALQAYPFPGNVRELENILERAMTLCEGNRITEADLRLSRGNEPLSGEFEQPDLSAGQDLETALSQSERDAILRALEQTRYNKTAAARLLGLTLRQLRYRIKKYGIE